MSPSKNSAAKNSAARTSPKTADKPTELGALPEIRTIANPSLIELRRAAEGPLPTPLYPTAMIGGPAWYGPAPDHPPLLPRLVPDLAARIRYHSHHLFGTSPKPGAAIGPVPVSPGFTWRDWLTSRDDPAIVRR